MPGGTAEAYKIIEPIVTKVSLAMWRWWGRGIILVGTFSGCNPPAVHSLLAHVESSWPVKLHMQKMPVCVHMQFAICTMRTAPPI